MATYAPPRLSLPVGPDDHVRGPQDAPVTLVEYGDYECPHCRQVHPIIEELRARLGNRLRYVFRHFPIRTTHPHAQRAAEAAEAAGAQGKFWPMHALLFERQEALEEADLAGYAAELGLDVARFQQEMAERTYSSHVREDFMGGVRSGANGTPTFFINGLRYDGPWDLESLLAEIEKPLGVQVRQFFQEFARRQASAGALLMIGALAALLWANTPWSESYFHFLETPLSITLGNLSLSEPIFEWVNDGLMTLFFFIVGLEIKRELTVGELASFRRAALPFSAALGGMLLPAAIYFAVNAGTDTAHGWGIPMATDIAFTLALLTVLGNRISLSLKIFFTALAIADDLGAVVVIAVFYSSGVAWGNVLLAVIFLLMLLGLNQGQVRNPLPYGAIGVALWLALLGSGVHPTIGGVILALTIPSRAVGDMQAFLAQCISTLGDFGLGLPSEGRQEAATVTLERIAERLQSPAQRLDRTLGPWVTYTILPLFALANVGVRFEGNVVAGLRSPLGLGILLGLVVGKPLGLSLFAWLAVRAGIAELPGDLKWGQLFSASWLAGIGFTISLFIAELAFDSPAVLDSAKVSIFAASVLAAALGTATLLLTCPRTDQVTAAAPAELRV